MGQIAFSLSLFLFSLVQEHSMTLSTSQDSSLLQKRYHSKLALQKSAVFLLKTVMKIISQLGIGARNNATATAAKKKKKKIKLHFSVLN